MTKEFRTYVEDVDRTLYDISDATVRSEEHTSELQSQR